MELAVLLYALSAGMVATVNPCGFAMLPAYVSYYLATGHEVDQRQRGNPGGLRPALELSSSGLWLQSAPAGTISRLSQALLVGGTLTVGFLVLFALAGTLISLGARVLITAMPWIGLLIGVSLVLLSLWLLLGRHLPLPGLPQIKAGRERTLKSIFLFGVAYGLASLSCTLPIFLAIVGSAFTTRGVAAGLALFLAYGLGMGAVLMVLTISVALFEGVLVDYLRRLLPYVERISALLLLGAGVYIVYYWLTAGQLLRSLGS